MIYFVGLLFVGVVLFFFIVEFDKVWLFIIFGLMLGLIWVLCKFVYFDVECFVYVVLCGFVVIGFNVIFGVFGFLLDVFFIEMKVDWCVIVVIKVVI